MASESDSDSMQVSPQRVARIAARGDESETLCCVCFETGENGHVHSFAQCVGCGVVVHRDCYGAPLVREEPECMAGTRDWTCDSCAWGGTEEVRCVLCPERGGLMKRTTDWRWAHLSCALWIPEVFFRYGEGREPVDYFQVNGKRFKKHCAYCESSEGACVDCTEPRCNRAFHITCGIKHNVYLEYRENNAAGGADQVISLCDTHAKKWNDRKAGKGKR